MIKGFYSVTSAHWTRLYFCPLTEFSKCEFLRHIAFKIWLYVRKFKSVIFFFLIEFLSQNSQSIDCAKMSHLNFSYSANFLSNKNWPVWYHWLSSSFSGFQKLILQIFSYVKLTEKGRKFHLASRKRRKQCCSIYAKKLLKRL